jgi:aminoglycoside phosphotransferase (APT) family kinase protein
VNLDDCLPHELRGATITKISRGMSGAGVYRVDAPAGAFVLKINEQPLKREIVELAAAAGLAPRVIHVDLERRALVTELVVDKGFMPWLMTPETRARAIGELGRTLRRVHELPIPPGTTAFEPLDVLRKVQLGLGGLAVPIGATTAIEHMMFEPPPPRTRVALCHGDLNPSNLMFDGERVILLDWDTAGPNDPLIDLAAASVFLRLDDAATRALIAAHDGAPAEIPASYSYYCRLVATAIGAIFLVLARRLGHPGSSADAPRTFEECYAAMRAGELDLATADGRWTFGLALLAHSRTFHR